MQATREAGPVKITVSLEPNVAAGLDVCTVCGMRKHPWGRDPGVAAANGYCGHDCPGYRQNPRPGGLWPGELYGDSLGHMPWHEERR